MRHGKISDRLDAGKQLAADEQQCVAHLNYVGVVAHKTACRAEMYDGFCLGALIAESENVSHDVVAHFFLARGGVIIVYIVHFGLHLSNLLVRDVDAQRLLRLGKRNPQSAPSAKLEVGREDVLHFFACVPLAKR